MVTMLTVLENTGTKFLHFGETDMLTFDPIYFEMERRKLRLLAKIEVDHTTRCWNWQANKKRNGLPYGFFYWGLVDGKEKMMTAHRASYLIHVGSIEPNKHILHRCNNASCINPEHLYIGDHKQNMKDRDESGRTSRGEKRYNYKRSGKMLENIKVEFTKGGTIKEVADRLGIGYQTIYRAAKQDASVREAMLSVRKANYTRAALAKGKG